MAGRKLFHKTWRAQKCDIKAWRDQVVIAQWLAWRPAMGEVPGSNPSKGDNLLISDRKGNIIYSNLNTNIVWVYEKTGLV